MKNTKTSKQSIFKILIYPIDPCYAKIFLRTFFKKPTQANPDLKICLI